jgi:hypothetical protein
MNRTERRSRAAIILFAAILAGCATTATEVCGQLPDGSEYCAIITP